VNTLAFNPAARPARRKTTKPADLATQAASIGLAHTGRIEIHGKLYRVEYRPHYVPDPDEPGAVVIRETGGRGRFRFVQIEEPRPAGNPLAAPIKPRLRIFVASA
jgi:hypothetical protein